MKGEKPLKKQGAKKSKIWILLAAFLVLLLVIVGLVLTMCSGPAADNPTGPSTDPTDDTKTPVTGEVADLYWNVDRLLYAGMSEAGLSSRVPAEDGYYHFTFAFEGKHVELKAEDRQLVNRIDGMDVMGLTVDDNGVITEVFNVDDITGGFVAEGFYVQSVDAETVEINSSSSFGGMALYVKIGEITKIYDVSPTAALVGAESKLNRADRVHVIQNTAGEVTHIYIISRPVVLDVYWNVNRMYNSTDRKSTRVPDENGEYSILLAVNGEQVTLKTKSESIVNSIDSAAAKCFGLTVDDNGYITGFMTAAAATGGGSLASWYDVMEFDGVRFQAKKLIDASDTGNEAIGTLAENCGIYDVSGTGEFVGIATDLRVGDRVHCLTDVQGEVCVIFVVNRLVDSPMYWNLSRQYDSAKGSTTRKPNAQGYYEFKLAHEGGNSTFRTSDKEIASAVDAIANRNMGLKVDGDIILKVYGAGTVSGGSVFASWFDVTSISGNFVQTLKDPNGTASDAGATKAGFLAADCKVYDVTTAANVQGEVTELRVGDRIQGWTNAAGEVTYIWVISGRTVNADMAWNISRKYDGTKKVTTRQPENGWYIFDMAVNGKQVTLRTRDKEIATQVDSYPARCMGLKIDGTTITKVYSAGDVTGGSSVASWYDVEYWVSSNSFFAKKNIAATDTGKTVTVEMAPNCVVYNVSSGYVNNIGEKTTLRVGDRVHCLKNNKGQASVIYVVERPLQADLYYNVTRMYNSTTKETTRKPDGNGWYNILMAVNGKQVTVKTQDVAIASQIDSYVTPIMGIIVDDDNVVTRVASAASVSGYQGGFVGDWGDVMTMAGNKIHIVKTSVASNTGKEWDLVLAKDYIAYDVSSSATMVGEKATLELGDRVVCVCNKNGEAAAVYIMTKNTHTCSHGTAGYHYCDHCGEVVLWEGWNGTSNFNTSVTDHYYLTRDAVRTSQMSVGSADKPRDIVLCLNGHTLESNSRAFLVWYGSTLTILDHSSEKVEEQGWVIGRGPAPTKDSNGNITAADHTGVILVNAGELNIYGGNYKVADDEKTNPISSNGLIHISTNCTANFYGGTFHGTDLTKSGFGSVGGSISLSGTLNIYDGVTITGGTAWSAGNIRTSGSAVVNMYGGTIEGGKAISRYTKSTDAEGKTTYSTSSGYGGNVYLDGTSVFNFYGGTIRDGRTERAYHPETTASYGGNGGNVYVSANATFNMLASEDGKTSGTVTGGYSGNCGGNFVLYGTLNMRAGTVDKGTSYSTGPNIFTVNAAVLNISGGTLDGKIDQARSNTTMSFAQINLSGTPVVTDLSIPADHSVSVDGLKDGADIRVSAGAIFTNGTPEDPDDAYAKYFSVTTPITGCEVVSVDGALGYGKNQCECGGVLADDPNHECKELFWTAWTSKDSLPTTTGNYILAASGTVGKQYTIASGATVRLDLNGQTITSTDFRIFRDLGATSPVTLTITDSSANRDGKLVAASRTDGDQGGLLWITAAKSRVILYAGILDASNYTSDWIDEANKNGGAPGVYLSSTSNMTMYGGEILGGTASSSLAYGFGGAVFVGGSASFTMNGGKISGGRAKTGGNIRLNGTMIMNGGEITGGQTNATGGHGGNIDISANGSLTVNGGIISNGASSSYGGGNLAVYGGGTKFTMTGGTITGGNAGTGGNILASSGTMTITGGTIENGTASTGGNITLWDKSAMTIGGNAQILNGTATNGGGNLNVNKDSTVNLEGDALIRGGVSKTAGNYGTNLHIVTDSANRSAQVNIKDNVRIIATDAISNPNIYIAGKDGDTQKPTINMTGGTISGGKSINAFGGNVAVGISGVFKMSGGVVENGETYNTLKDDGTTNAARNGGNLYIAVGGEAIISGGTIRNGVSHNTAGNISNSGTLRITNGAVIEGGECYTNAGARNVSKTDNIQIASGVFELADVEIKGGVSVYNATSVKFSGVVVIDDGDDSNVHDFELGTNFRTGTSDADYVYKRIDATELKDGSRIGITVGGVDRAFADCSGYEAKNYFFYTDGTDTNKHVVGYRDGTLWKLSGTAETVGCECGGVLDHEHYDEKWTKWTSKTSLPTSGNIILTEDVTLSSQLTIAKGGTLRIDLNGHDITTTTTRIFRDYQSVAENKLAVTLTITDSSKDRNGSVTMAETTNTQGSIIWFGNKGSVAKLYAGTLDDSKYTCSYDNGGGAIILENADEQFLMYGGTIIAGKATGTMGGAAIRVVNAAASFEMYDGTIIGSAAEKASKVGGAVTVSGKFTMHGGTIRDGHASSGGNLLVSNTGVFTMLGGTISGGTAATGSGGNIQIWDSGKAYIGVDSEGKTSDQEILVTGGVAGNNGGNLYADKNCTIVIGGEKTVISNGTSGKGAANIHIAASDVAANTPKLTIQDSAVITGGTSATDFGHVYINGNQATVTLAGKITIHDADKRNLSLGNQFTGQIDATGLLEGTKIGIAVSGDVTRAFAKVAGESAKDLFLSNLDGYTVAYENGTLHLASI